MEKRRRKDEFVHEKAGRMIQSLFIAILTAICFYQLSAHYGAGINPLWGVAVGITLAVLSYFVLPLGAGEELYVVALPLSAGAFFLRFGIMGVTNIWLALLVAAVSYSIFQFLAPTGLAHRLNAAADRHPIHFAGSVGLAALAAGAVTGYLTRDVQDYEVWLGLQSRNGAIIVALFAGQLLRCIKQIGGSPAGEGSGKAN